jgi:hypothetical protein
LGVLGDSNGARPGTTETFEGNDLVCGGTEGVMGHALGVVVVVVVGSGDSPTGAFLLTDRPVLDVVAAAVDGADLVGAAVAGEGALVGALGTGVVGAIVFKNLLYGRAGLLALLIIHAWKKKKGGGWLLTYVVLALPRPGVHSEVEVALGIDISSEGDVAV